MSNFDPILQHIRSKIEESTIREETSSDDPFELYDDENSKRNKALATSEIKKILNGFIQKVKRIVSNLKDPKIAKEVEDCFYTVQHVNDGEPLELSDINLKIDDEAKEKLNSVMVATSKKLNKYGKYGVGDTATDEAIATYIKRRLQGSGMEESVNEDDMTDDQSFDEDSEGPQSLEFEEEGMNRVLPGPVTKDKVKSVLYQALEDTFYSDEGFRDHLDEIADEMDIDPTESGFEDIVQELYKELLQNLNPKENQISGEENA